MTATDTMRPSAGKDNALRGMSVLGSLLLLIVSAIMIAASVDIANASLCSDTVFGECFDGSSAEKTIRLVLGFGGGAIAAIGAVAAFAYALTGRRGRLAVLLAVVGILASTLSILA